jgi:hypothetical protein
VLCFNCVFELPLLRNAQKRVSKKSIKPTEGEKKETEEKKATVLVMSPDRWTFLEKKLFVFLNSLCYETLKKGSKWLLFFGAAAKARHFRHFCCVCVAP